MALILNHLLFASFFPVFRLWPHLQTCNIKAKCVSRLLVLFSQWFKTRLCVKFMYFISKIDIHKQF